jgi:cell division protein FtsZ
LPTLHFDVDPVAPASPAPTVANHGPRAQPSVRVEPTIGLRPPPQAPRRDPAQGTLSIDRPPAARQEAQIDVRNMTVSQAVAALAEADKPVAAAEPGRRSFIDRLTGNARQVTPPAGPARRIEPAPPAYAPSLEASAPAAARISAGDRGGNTRQEEDMLDIPAFLRRQAN